VGKGEYYNANQRQCREPSHAASGASSTLRGKRCRRAASTKCAPTSVHRVGELPSIAPDVHAASRTPSGDVEGNTDRPSRSVRGRAVEGRAPGHAGRSAARSREGGRGARRCGRRTDGDGGGGSTRGTPRARRAATVRNGAVERGCGAGCARAAVTVGACPKRTFGAVSAWLAAPRATGPASHGLSSHNRDPSNAVQGRDSARPARGRVPPSNQSVSS